jgi:outer membrane protein assembly factor BamB
MTFMLRALCGFLFLPAGVSLALAQPAPGDWTQWRGPNRDGGVPSFAAPKAWPAQLTARWKVEVGLGYATPVVIGNRVYMFARRGGDEVLSAHDAATGKELWATRYAAPYDLVRAASPHGMGPKGTPVFADGRLFTLGISGILSAFDAASGKLLWQKPAPPSTPFYSTAQSPMVDRGRVIVHVGGMKGGALTAFEAATGKELWRWSGDGPSYASPIVAEFGGTRQVITFTQDNLVGVSADTGELLWLRPFKTPNSVNANTPLLYRDMVIVSGQEAGITAFRITRQQNKWVTENVWKNDDVFYRLTNGIVVRDAVFSLSPESFGFYFYVDAQTGKTLWRGEPRAAENAAIMKAGDLLIILEHDGELVIANGSDTTRLAEVRRYKVSDQATWAQPAISGNRVFVKDLNTLALWTID